MALSFLALLIITTYTEAQANGQAELACKNTSTYGYGYTQFYPIMMGERRFSFELSFKVKTVSDAHILLSPTPSFSESSPSYEVVLGASSNTMSDIRKTGLDQTRIHESGIVSVSQFRGFWITVDYDFIKVGREGDKFPYIYWKDPHPLFPHYFSFGSWNNVYAEWKYDCKRLEAETSTEPAFETTPRERRIPQLRVVEDLLYTYNPYLQPANSNNNHTLVYIKFITEHVKLDEIKSSISVTGILEMRWEDARLKWNPKNYSGVTKVNMETYDIWHPNIILYNDAGDATKASEYSIHSTSVIVSHEGIISWGPIKKYQAFCNLDFTSWPFDTQTCKLYFESQQSSVIFSFPQNATQISMHHSESQWKIVKLSADNSVSQSPWLDVSGLSPNANAAFTIKIILHRQTTLLFAIFYLPLFGIAITTLSSFWMSPKGHTKIMISCCNLIIMAMFLVLLVYVIPTTTNHSPLIVHLYTSVLVMIAASLITAVMVSYFTRYDYAYAMPHVLKTALTGWIRYILFLPREKLERSMYKNVDTSRNNTGVFDIAQSTTEHSQRMDEKWYWYVLGVAIDRIVFLVYCVTLISLFAKYKV